ncbi:transposase [Alienimonas californiensis]|uniref:Uncharacterized protein n=1 Tax=Alienimonas californiensis TaxID=2527989 RepID=A0A517P5G6_9PLAN|nr:transposase [Alienimonas californiensis]QDT14617.1 hypothetical protein CA12_06930 [Alienimonas californiensis]
MRRFKPTDGQWGLVREALPENGWRGGQLREVPERCGTWKSAHGRFDRRAKGGALLKILGSLRLKLHHRGRIDSDLWCFDTTVVRASGTAASTERGTADGRSDS